MKRINPCKKGFNSSNNVSIVFFQFVANFTSGYSSSFPCFCITIVNPSRMCSYGESIQSSNSHFALKIGSIFVSGSQSKSNFCREVLKRKHIKDLINCIEVLKVQIGRTFKRVYINLDTWKQFFQQLPAAFFLSRSLWNCLYLYPQLRFESYRFCSTPQEPDGASLKEKNIYVDSVRESHYHFSNAIQKNIFEYIHQRINPTSTFYRNYQAKKRNVLFFVGFCFL